MAKEVPPLITYQRPAGRLDFNVGYDVSEAIRIDVGGTNILRHNSSTYYDYPGYTHINHFMEYDETTYSVGIRMRIRSEERRVGNECVRTCRSRGSRYHKKQKKKVINKE